MYTRILFATDLTDEMDHLISKVRTIREFSKATLSIVHVVEPLPGYMLCLFGQ